MKLVNLRFINDAGEGMPPVDRFVLVDVPDRDFDQFKAELEDSVASYMEAEFSPLADAPWTKAVRDIMGACGRPWIPIRQDDVQVLRI